MDHSEIREFYNLEKMWTQKGEVETVMIGNDFQFSFFIMKYLISAIGKMKTSPEAKIFNEYSKRIKDLTLLEYVSRFPKERKE